MTKTNVRIFSRCAFFKTTNSYFAQKNSENVETLYLCALCNYNIRHISVLQCHCAADCCALWNGWFFSWNSRAIYTTSLAGPSLGSARAGRGLVHFTSAIQTRLASEVWRHHRSKRVSSLSYSQTTALCSRRQMTYRGKRAAPNPTTKPNRVRLESVPGQPRTNEAFRAQPELNPEMFASVNGLTRCGFCLLRLKTKLRTAMMAWD